MANYDVSTAAASLEFDTQNGLSNSCAMVDANHFINFWRGGSGVTGIAQVFAINTTTWAVTTAAALLTFEASQNADNSCAKVDTNHFINFWQEASSGDGFAQVFTVNTTTWAVTTAAASLEFNTQDASSNACCAVDANHFINFYAGVSNDGFVQTFEVNTTTFAVTTKTTGQGVEFDTQNSQGNACVKIDTNHIINFWGGRASNNGYTQVFAVNTTTWVVTTAAAEFNFVAVAVRYNTCQVIDATHILNVWLETSSQMQAQVFAVNTTTWVVTTAGAPFVIPDSSTIAGSPSSFKVDTNHFIIYYCGASGDGYTQVLAINTSTWAVTAAANSLEFDTGDSNGNSCFQIDTAHYVNFWAGPSSDGFVQTFTVVIPAEGPANLKTYNTNVKSNIKAIDTNPLANIKTLNTNA